jgi:hypothetical protein
VRDCRGTAVHIAEEWISVVPEGTGSRTTYERNVSRA